MKKNIFKLNFLVFSFIILFIGIKNVSAADYSYANCTYTDDLKGGNFDLTIQYNQEGKVYIPSTIESWIPGKLMAVYNVVNVDLDKNDFISGQMLKGVCPGNNDLDYYQVDSTKTIYIATTEKQLDKYISKKKLSGGKKYKAKIKSQEIHQGDTIKIDGNDVQVKEPLDCIYTGKGLVDNIRVELKLSDAGEVVYTKLTAKDAPHAKITKIIGKFEGGRCPDAISLNGTDGTIGLTTKNVNLYSDPTQGDFKLNYGTSVTEDGKEDTGPNIELSTATGCGMWGSLLNFLKNDIFAVIKYSLVGFLTVFGILDFSKALFSGEEKELKNAGNKLLKRIIVVIIIFLLPVLIETIIKLILSNEGINVDTCIKDF